MAIPLGYIDPATEIASPGETQIWKITHNGVDTHAIHFHLFNAQLINRIGWDGMIKPPDPNELGWKDTIRMNPLEDIVVAVKYDLPTIPFTVPNSVRLLNPAMPLGSTLGFTGVDPNTNNPITVTNQLYNFGREYVWHCHLLGHEENDMMRPMVVRKRPPVDFDGEFKTDIAVYQASTGAWSIQPSSGAAYTVTWGGNASDILVPGDYDGDGKTDIAIYRNGIWAVVPSKTGTAYVVPWGTSTDIPVPSDYDGDGKTDIAIYRNGIWAIIPSSGAAPYAVGWGATGDVPVTSY